MQPSRRSKVNWLISLLVTSLIKCILIILPRQLRRKITTLIMSLLKREGSLSLRRVKRLLPC